MNVQLWIAGIAVLITFSTFLATVLYKTGNLSGRLEHRVEALEEWRGTMRSDMHEISEQMRDLVVEVKALHTLIQERTERRVRPRPLGAPASLIESR